MNKLRVGVIGLGVGARHVGCFDAHEACEVTTLCDIDADKLREIGGQFPEKKVVAEAEAVISDPDIDVVSIASFDDLHFEQIVAGIQHGKHIFVEKPMCLQEEHYLKVRRLLEANPQIKVSSNHVLRISSRFQRLKHQIKAGEYGDIFYLEGDYQYGRLEKLTSGWRGKIDYYSGVLGGGIHVIDLLLWLTDSEPVEVSAFGNKIASRNTAFRHLDMVAALIRMKSGIIAKITANFGCHRPHFHSIEVYGSKKTFLNRPGPAEVFTSKQKGADPELMDVPYYDYQKPELICSFVDWILDRGEPVVTPRDIYRAMATCFAIEKAVISGNPTPVNY